MSIPCLVSPSFYQHPAGILIHSTKHPTLVSPATCKSRQERTSMTLLPGHTFLGFIFLKDTCARYRILGWWFLFLCFWCFGSFRNLKILCCPLAGTVSHERSLLPSSSLFLFPRFVLSLQLRFRFSLCCQFYVAWSMTILLRLLTIFLSFFDLWVYSFNQIWKNTGHYIFEYFSFLPFLSFFKNYNYIYINVLEVVA